MNLSTTGPALRQALSSKINSLDIQINKLSKWFNAISFKSGSIMLSGQNLLGKDFHELIVWNSELPMPVDRIRQFIHLYCEDLICRRTDLVQELGQIDIEPGDQLPEPIESWKQSLRSDPGAKETGHCPHCSKQTGHTLFALDPDKPESIRVWQCDECDNAIEFE
jgi:hypothetical protein